MQLELANRFASKKVRDFVTPAVVDPPRFWQVRFQIGNEVAGKIVSYPKICGRD